MCLHAFGGILAEMVTNMRFNEVTGLLAKKSHVAVKRSVAIVSREPRAHLLVRQPLQLSSLATHPVVLRRQSLRPFRQVLPRDWLRPG